MNNEFTTPDNFNRTEAISHYVEQLHNNVDGLEEEQAEFIAEALYDATAPVFHAAYTKPKRDRFMQLVATGETLASAANIVAEEFGGEPLNNAHQQAQQALDAALDNVLKALEAA